MKARELVFTRAIVSGSLLCSAGLALVLALKTQSAGWGAVFVGLVVGLLALRALATRLYRAGRPIDWLLAVAVLNLVLVVELALWTIDFQYLSRIEFGYPRPVGALHYVAHEDLFWVHSTSTPGVNSLGFRGDEIAVPKPEGVYRIVFLGDSVTAEGYPSEVERLLNQSPPLPEFDFESAELAVHGYSSHQGRVLSELYGTLLEPDLVVVYFGWNDHWQAYGAVDADKEVRSSVWAGAYRQSRLLQYVGWLGDAISGANLPIGQVRVPLDQYRRNLEAILEVFAGREVPVLLVTAPTSHHRLGVPDFLVVLRFVEDEATAVSLHEQYNQAVREIGQGAGRGVFLLDLAAAFEDLSDRELAEAFTEDGIHLSQQGKQLVGGLISDFVKGRIVAQSTLPEDSD